MPGREVIKPWAIAEVKEPLVFVYIAYVEGFDAWVKGIHKLDSRTATKKRFISAFLTFYHVCEPYFIAHFNSIKEQLDCEVDVTIKNYTRMLMQEPDDQQLFEMARILNYWNFTQGFFRVHEKEMVYDNVQEMRDAEENM